jgi:hypothetical protein
MRDNRERVHVLKPEIDRREKQRLKMSPSQSCFETERVWSQDHTLSVWRHVP